MQRVIDSNPNHTNINFPIRKLGEDYTKYRVLPIPQDEVGLVPNVMWQNPGW
ncbi:MAG: RagB/SusD family nutrient uptake outer membrane protein [Bacteroides sp.]|nr:RagB/SusD family nutrient uptake outer membrane protein [Bacteroides sp.]